ncbi:helix-turn-helix transcriptional regulator [Flavobacterium sp. LBUM151]
MADQLGVTQAGYSKIEKGKTVLSYIKLVEIARILDVSVEDIISNKQNSRLITRSSTNF